MNFVKLFQSTYLDVLVLIAVFLISACSGSQKSTDDSTLEKAEITPEKLVNQLQRSPDKISSVSGKAKAFISQPNTTDRASVTFNSNGDSTLINVKNRIGIEGGLLLVTKDSLLLYNKIDKYIKKVHKQQNTLPELNGIGAFNLIDLLRFQFTAGEVERILKKDTNYVVHLVDGRLLEIATTEELRVTKLSVPYSSPLPYSSVLFEAYSTIDGYSLPRKLTIFNRVRSSKVVLIINQLKINPTKLDLTPAYPEEMEIQHL